MKRKLEDDFIDDANYKRQRLEEEDSYSQSSSQDSSDSGDSQSQNSSDYSDSEDEPDPTLVQAGPRIQIGAAGAIAHIQYIGGGPVYTPSPRPGAGGCLSTVVLGPGGYVSKNSDADRSAIPAILAAEAAGYPHTFKAGHLLNAEFGGSGDDPDNLTILTTAANSAQRSFDEAVKLAVQTTLTHAYTVINSMGIDVSTLGYGIQVTITAQPTFWSNVVGNPGYLITDGLTCQAAIVGEPAIATLEGVLTATYGAARVPNHANLVATLNGHIATLQNDVAAANMQGVVNNP